MWTRILSAGIDTCEGNWITLGTCLKIVVRESLASYFTENIEVTRKTLDDLLPPYLSICTSICSHRLSACGHRSFSQAPIKPSLPHLSIRSLLSASQTISKKSSSLIFYFVLENSIGKQHAIIIHLSFKKVFYGLFYPCHCSISLLSFAIKLNTISRTCELQFLSPIFLLN